MDIDIEMNYLVVYMYHHFDKVIERMDCMALLLWYDFHNNNHKTMMDIDIEMNYLVVDMYHHFDKVVGRMDCMVLL